MFCHQIDSKATNMFRVLSMNVSSCSLTAALFTINIIFCRFHLRWNKGEVAKEGVDPEVVGTEDLGVVQTCTLTIIHFMPGTISYHHHGFLHHHHLIATQRTVRSGHPTVIILLLNKQRSRSNICYNKFHILFKMAGSEYGLQEILNCILLYLVIYWKRRQIFLFYFIIVCV